MTLATGLDPEKSPQYAAQCVSRTGACLLTKNCKEASGPLTTPQAVERWLSSHAAATEHSCYRRSFTVLAQTAQMARPFRGVEPFTMARDLRKDPGYEAVCSEPECGEKSGEWLGLHPVKVWLASHSHLKDTEEDSRYYNLIFSDHVVIGEPPIQGPRTCPEHREGPCPRGGDVSLENDKGTERHEAVCTSCSGQSGPQKDLPAVKRWVDSHSRKTGHRFYSHQSSSAWGLEWKLIGMLYGPDGNE